MRAALRKSPDACRAPLIAAILALAMSGCRAEHAEEGVPFACDCTFLTDYDDSSKIEARICAPARDGARARSIAQGCAQRGAPGHIETCTCREERGPRCELGCLSSP